MNKAQSRLQDRIDYHFNDKALFEQALTHRSAGVRNNERLEFLGDAVINLLMAERLFKEYPEAKEGRLTRMRANLVKGIALADISRELDVGQCLNLGPGELKSGGHRRDSMLADVLEAIVGAMYLEAGLDTCREKIAPWFESRIVAAANPKQTKDPKTRLQEWLQARGEPVPNYEVIATSGEAHNQVFTVSCFVGSLASSSEGRGSSRRSAEQVAAEKTLEKLMSGNHY